LLKIVGSVGDMVLTVKDTVMLNAANSLTRTHGYIAATKAAAADLHARRKLDNRGWIGLIL
jgi:proteasome assembly chaperone (PAC2) family protein